MGWDFVYKLLKIYEVLLISFNVLRFISSITNWTVWIANMGATRIKNMKAFNRPRKWKKITMPCLLSWGLSIIFTCTQIKFWYITDHIYSPFFTSQLYTTCKSVHLILYARPLHMAQTIFCETPIPTSSIFLFFGNLDNNAGPSLIIMNSLCLRVWIVRIRLALWKSLSAGRILRILDSKMPHNFRTLLFLWQIFRILFGFEGCQ